MNRIQANLAVILSTVPCVLAFVLGGISVADEPNRSAVSTHELGPHWDTTHSSLLSMAVSPDGQLLATAGTLPGNAASLGDVIVKALRGSVPTGGVQLRLLDDGQVTQQVNNLSKTIRQVVFSPDGKTLAIGCGSWTGRGQVVLVESATGKILTRFAGHSGWVHSVAFSPDGNRIISGGSKSPRYDQLYGGEVWVWDVRTGEGQRIWLSNQHSVISTAYSPDGRHFATAGGDQGMITLWDAETDEPKFQMNEHTLLPSGLAFSADGETLVAANSGWGSIPPHRYDAKLIFWDVTTGRSKKTVNVTKWWPERRTIVFGELAFSPDGKYLALPMGSWNRGGNWAQLSLLNVEQPAEGQTVFAAENHRPVTSAGFSDSGKILIAAFGNGEIRRWRIDK